MINNVSHSTVRVMSYLVQLWKCPISNSESPSEKLVPELSFGFVEFAMPDELNFVE